MPRGQKYRCTRCENLRERSSLVVKKVTFFRMGAGGKLIKSRVIDWLCPSCTIKDPDWNIPDSAGVPRPRRISA